MPTRYKAKALGPLIARPGSIDNCGTARSRAAHSWSMISRSARASSAGVAGESALVYAMPKPPPRSSSSGTTPVWATNSACSRSVRRAATSNASASKICEPMWEWMPASSSQGCAWQASRASAAVPPAIENPNF